MMRVLIIGNIWPYTRGNFRVSGLAKYISEFDWEPTVLTMPLPPDISLPYRIVQVQYKDWLQTLVKRLSFKDGTSVKKQIANKLNVTSRNSFLDFLFKRLSEILTYPDDIKGWEQQATKKAFQLLDKEHFDAIISTSPPISSHLLAHKIKGKYRIPWVADFPHLWSQNNGYPYGDLRHWFDQRLELKTLSNTDTLVAVSNPMTEKLRGLNENKPVHTITHGFAPETLNLNGAQLTVKFTLTFTGSWHPTLREPSLLLVALSNLIKNAEINPDEVEIRFYGDEEIWLETYIDNSGLSRTVKQYGRVSHLESIAHQRESQVLFQPKWNDPHESGVMSMKIFEYLSALRPILAVGKYKDVVDDVLSDTNAGICVSSQKSIEEALRNYYYEFKATGQVSYHGNIKNIEKYSQRCMAGKFAQLLNNIQASSL
jgi:hypothetical protein